MDPETQGSGYCSDSVLQSHSFQQADALSRWRVVQRWHAWHGGSGVMGGAGQTGGIGGTGGTQEALVGTEEELVLGE